MSTKVFLAKAIKDLEQCHAKERTLDALQEKLANSSSSRKELSQLKRDYSVLYDRMISAIEHLNYVRNNAGSNGDMKNYCESMMKLEMDRAERLRDKEANILLPIELIGDVSKDGYVKKAVLFHHDGTKKPLLKDGPLKKSLAVASGCYLVTVRNHDDYMAAPNVEVTIGCSPQRTMRRLLPGLCGWARFVGTIHSSTIEIQVTTNATRRQAHISVEVQQLVEPQNDWGDLPHVTTARTNPPPPPPPAPCVVGVPVMQPLNPAEYRGALRTPLDLTLSFRKRLAVVGRMAELWPVNNVMACPMSVEEQRLIQAISNLPIPRPT